MYGLPSDTDLRFLLYQELYQVCIGKHQIIFNFEKSSITVESRFMHVVPERGVSYEWTPSRLDTTFTPTLLLHEKIEAYRIEPPGTLRLCFTNGNDLVIYDDSDQYESYTIVSSKRYIVV